MSVSTTSSTQKAAQAAAPLLGTQAMASFDTLSYAKVLQQGGVPAKQAEAMATALLQYLRNEVATRHDIVLLKSDIAGVKAELKGDIAEVKAELKGDIAGVKAELKGDIATLRAEFKGVRWVISVLLVLGVANLGFSISLFGFFLAQL